jgi:acetylornithine deacetylase
MAANATAVLSIRVAADLDETIALVKSVVGKHEGVKLTIEVSLPPVPLDSDVGGFQTIVVSYFTVHSPYCFTDVQDVPHLRGDFKRYLYGPGRYYALEISDFANNLIVLHRLMVRTSMLQRQIFWRRWKATKS